MLHAHAPIAYGSGILPHNVVSLRCAQLLYFEAGYYFGSYRKHSNFMIRLTNERRNSEFIRTMHVCYC